MQTNVPNRQENVDDSSTIQAGTMPGIVSVVAGVFGLTQTFGIVMSIVGLITGIIGRKQARKVSNRTGVALSTAGIIISAVTFLFSVIFLLFIDGPFSLIR